MTLDYLVNSRLSEYREQYANERVEEAKKNNIDLSFEDALKGVDFGYEEAREEVIANALEDMFDKPDVMKKLAYKEKSLFKRLWQTVMNILDKLLDKLGKLNFKTPEARIVAEATRKQQKELNTLFVNALRSANEGAKARGAGTVGETDLTNTNSKQKNRHSFIGRTEDGRGIYRTNYPDNTPKYVKQKDVIELVQNVWSKKPIKLNLIVDDKILPIEARFNPELAERSDLSKIAFGNRKGTASEKRITMNLSSDLYQIAKESHHVGSKTETGKNNATHTGVAIWHYFVTDLVYVEADGTEIECYMNIDVKQNDSGNWFYSFAIEKGSRPADVLSVVTDESATTSTNIIPDTEQKSNTFSEKSSRKRQSFAGYNAKTADKMKLEIAKQMLEDGLDSETIRKETGWFKGYDGKWRFEIDDSDIEIAFNGKFSRNPDIKRYAELVEKVYFLADATEAEQNELVSLDKKLGNKNIAPDKLGDMINHPDLFEAYPQLADIDVYFHEGNNNTASYHPGFKEIALPKQLKMNPKQFKKTLLHEIQHAVQDIEGFAGGSNVDMFNSNEERSAYEQYASTAGEIEARDASSRGDMTAEQRKNTRPDIDRTDVVFASDSSISYALAENAEAEIDSVLKDRKYSDYVKLTENTPSILLAQKGVKNLPLFMKPSHLRENIFTEEEALAKGYKVDGYTNYHGLGKEKFIEVISDLDNVTEAYRGTKNAENPQRRERYFLLISKSKDANGNVINVPIYINEKAGYHNVVVDTNKVATVFGKIELQEYIRREIRKGNIVRIKKRSLPVSDAATPIVAPYNKNASMDSIPDTKQKSNTFSENSSENSSKKRDSLSGYGSREKLAEAFAELAMTEAEKYAIGVYEKKLGEIEKYTEEKKGLEETIKSLEGKNGYEATKQRETAKARIRAIDDFVARTDEKLL